MARIHGKDLSALTLNSQSLLADTIALNFKASAETHDTTTIGDDWKEFTGGLKGGDEFTHELFYDNTNTSGTYAFVTNLLGATATTLSFGDGTRTTAMAVIVKEVSTPINVADMVKLTVTYQISGTITFS